MTKTYLALLFAVSALLSIYAFAGVEENQSNASELDFVKDMDFRRFMGLWYDIASLPNPFEKNCKCPQSLDTLQSELVIQLAESCILFGRNTTSKGKAVATVNGYGNWTNWNGPISAPYWIINLDRENYQWVVIGQPSRKGFWIMNRKPKMDQGLLRELIDWGTAREFDLKNIEIADQSCFNADGEIVEVKVGDNGDLQLQFE